MGVTRIQHNLASMNAMSNYQGNQNALTNNLEKLSSGYRINSAADDAAGLAISEKMRSQIAGLEKAQDNANDGISLVQTAEGALTEVNSMLTRLKSLAVQSANGTYEDGVDRANIQEETNALLEEIDRISQSTNFNGIQLLDGSLSGKSQVANLGIDESVAVKGKYTTASAFTGVNKGGTTSSINLAASLTADDIGKSIDYTVTWQDAAGKVKTTTVSLTFQGNGEGKIDTAASEKNYFTDNTGAKYYLNTSGQLTASSVSTGMMKGLKANKEFSAAFTTKASTTANKLTFEAKADGTAGAKIISTGVSENLSLSSISMGGAGTATVSQVAYDSLQYFDASKISVATKTSTDDNIAAAIFEVDGHRFLAVDATSTGASFTATQRANVDSDVTIINITGGKSQLTASVNTKAIAAEVTRVTGLEARAITTTGSNGTIKTNSTAGLTAGSIAFTKDRLNLEGSELSLQIGDTNRDYQKVNVKIQDMSSKGLGLTGLDLSSQEAAGNAVDTIQDAINKVSTQRGQLGALQNRLDHTLNNLDATTQNITAAESQIRDVDMAKEMTQYSKNNILVQAAQSMLAQANSLPQGVLSLLQ
jgi:flagellin